MLTVCHALTKCFMYIITFTCYTPSRQQSYPYYTEVPQNLHKITEVISGSNACFQTLCSYLLCYSNSKCVNHEILQYCHILTAVKPNASSRIPGQRSIFQNYIQLEDKCHVTENEQNLKSLGLDCLILPFDRSLNFLYSMFPSLKR